MIRPSASPRRVWRALSTCALVALVAVGCQSPPEEFSVESPWTPIAAAPLVDTRFDLADVLEVLTDSLDTVPVGTAAGGELAFYHEQTFTGSIAEEWLLLGAYTASQSVVLSEEEALALNMSPVGQSVTLTETASEELDVPEPEGARLDRVELSAGQLSFTVSSTMGDDVSGNCTLPGLVNADGDSYSFNWNSFQFEKGFKMVPPSSEIYIRNLGPRCSYILRDRFKLFLGWVSVFVPMPGIVLS